MHMYLRVRVMVNLNLLRVTVLVEDCLLPFSVTFRDKLEPQ